MTCVVDPTAMRAAIALLRRELDVVDHALAQLAGVSVPAGVPADVAGRVRHAVDDAAHGLRAAGRALDQVRADLAGRRAALERLQEIENRELAFDLMLVPLQLFGGSFGAGVPSPVSRLGSAMGTAARNRQRIDLGGLRAGSGGPSGVRGIAARLKTPAGMGSALSRSATTMGIASAAWRNAHDPKLNTTQKVTRTLASAGGGAAVSALSVAGASTLAGAAGLAVFPPGFVVAVGAGVAWSVLDSKYHISDRVGDLAADGVDAVAGKAKDVVDDVVHTPGKLAADLKGLL
ncbi:hypothetical protein ABZ816_37050 [Actinosynnema sp. NPDC047251]|uniref:Putative membrane protein n=1 Tax=Saccharothrix espanaensis (strain ATCC 51144 / DSM 44229 / JCM 9112 / NBRC 15066 / NRRL 15764) TaxID=1179773 RepID=K0K4Y3_SACES|nr:hypothetical protein [Saccharothrix espanaensis]CCH32637.1 putative membrane protein [Saccharothrix espanaensis DSM 44229]